MNKRQWKKRNKRIALEHWLWHQSYLIQRDLMLYGTGYHRCGKHVPFHSVHEGNTTFGRFYYASTANFGKSPGMQLPDINPAWMDA